MAKYTLLQLVQKTLSYIDDFNVSSVSDTEEAEQVVTIANHVYNEIVSTYPWPHLKTEIALEAGSAAHILKLPTNVLGVDWIKYNKQELRWKDPKDMRDLLDGRDVTLSTVDANGAISDHDPVYWSSIDDEYIILDGYNGSLTPSLSLAGVIVSPAEMSDDSDYPDLPERFHSVLLNGIIAEAARVLKGDVTQGAIYDKKFRDGLNKMKRWARRINGVETTMPLDYGRKSVANTIKSQQVIEA